MGLIDWLQFFRGAVPAGDGTVLVCAIPFSIVEPGASGHDGLKLLPHGFECHTSQLLR